MKTIVFDIGGVMVVGDNMKTHYAPLIKSMKLNQDEFFKIYKKYVGKASTGHITGRKMISLIAKDLGVDNKKLLANWIKYKKRSVEKNVELIKIIKRLKKQGYKVGSLSGVLDLHNKLFAERGVYDVFDFNLYSYKIGYNKPDVRIYKYLLNKLKLPASDVLVIDDMQICLDSAKKLGINTILFKSNRQLVKDLKMLE